VGLSQTRGSSYRVVTTAYGVITTPFIVMPEFNPNNSQILGFGWILISSHMYLEVYRNCNTSKCLNYKKNKVKKNNNRVILLIHILVESVLVHDLKLSLW
jgi:hypothetical protein